MTSDVGYTAASRLARFVREQALPMWGSVGYDARHARFREQLDLGGSPVPVVGYRLMVQARQVATFARAGLNGWYSEGAELAKEAFETMVSRYRSPDGKPGWVSSIDEQHSVVDPTRDLYGHAFILFACAWMHSLTRDSAVLDVADATLDDIDSIFRTNNAGFASRSPDLAGLRHQNPHMHLLEGLLALAKTTGSTNYLKRAEVIISLFETIFVDPETGTVRETFTSAWIPISENGLTVIEPGHQFEWAWLLREYSRSTGVEVEEYVQRLIQHGLSYGVRHPTGQVYERVTTAGSPVLKSTRTWPQTEAFRVLAAEHLDERRDHSKVIAEILDCIFMRHCDPGLQGGWHDRADEYGNPLSNAMPASTLYHLAGAAMDVATIESHLRRGLSG